MDLPPKNVRYCNLLFSIFGRKIAAKIYHFLRLRSVPYSDELLTKLVKLHSRFNRFFS